MLAKKKSVTLSEEKISGEEIMPSTAEEWKNFKEEIQRQIEQGNKIIDFGKATRNAKYLAMLDRGFKQLDEGRGQLHELIEVE